MNIDFQNLALAEQVFERQRGHSAATRDHLARYGTLEQGDLGLILQMFLPVNEAFLGIGDRALDLSARAWGSGASRLSQTRELYQQAEEEAQQRAAAVARQLGMSPRPYQAPSQPTLGAAENGAGTFYGSADGSVFQQAFQDGYGAAEWLDGTASQASKRVSDGLAPGRVVTEAVDVRSFLSAPQADDPELESIRWKAGAIFGAVDWILEKFIGYSLLEEATKPFSGNWTSLNEGAIAWRHTGDALGGLSQNAAALVPPMAAWTGKGSENFLLATAAVSQAHTVMSGPASTVSSILKGLALIAKKGAALILKLLRRLQNRLLAIAAAAAVPVAGWVAAAVTAGISVVNLVQDALKVYKYVNMIYDFISGMVSSISATTDAWFRMADLIEGLARGTAARA